MWSTRDVLLVTVTVAVLAVVITILANRRINSMVDARVNEKSLSISPMLSVLGRMKDPGTQALPEQVEQVDNIDNRQVETLPDNLVPEPMYKAPVVTEAPQGSGIKWTPL